MSFDGMDLELAAELDASFTALPVPHAPVYVALVSPLLAAMQTLFFKAS